MVLRAPRVLVSSERPLLLASGSPRRREILQTLGIPHKVGAPPNVDESVLPGETPDTYLDRIVRRKLQFACIDLVAPSETLGDTLRNIELVAGSVAVVLVADTSVIDRDVILGKPRSLDEAEAMLARLAGRTHEVHTCFALGEPDVRGLALHVETVRTRVTFRALSDARIQAYAASGEGFDKAGAYAIQGRAAGFVSRIEGSYSNVVGLPASELVAALESLGLVS